MKQRVSGHWHEVWCKYSLNKGQITKKNNLKQTLHYCCEPVRRRNVCYAFSNLIGAKCKLFPLKRLCPVFPIYLEAQLSLEASTSLWFPPQYSAIPSRHIRQFPSRQHRLEWGASSPPPLCWPPSGATASLCSLHLLPCLQSCCSSCFLQSDHLQMQTSGLQVVFPAYNLRTSHELLAWGFSSLAQLVRCALQSLCLCL